MESHGPVAEGVGTVFAINLIHESIQVCGGVEGFFELSHCGHHGLERGRVTKEH